MGKREAFTLIELMIVVAIIGILAATAIPKFASLLEKSKEGYTKGAISSIRAALNVYYGSTEGFYPTDDLSVLVADAKYLSNIPPTKLPGTPHINSTAIHAAGTAEAAVTDAAGWAYVNDRADHDWGTVLINCTHADSAGVLWSTF